MIADHSDDSDFAPPPFSFAARMGHLATGVVKTATITSMLWALGLIGLIENFPPRTAIITGPVVMVAIRLATTGVKRLFALHHQHPDPRSFPMTVLVAVLPLPISFLVGLLTGRTLSGALATMVCQGTLGYARGRS